MAVEGAFDKPGFEPTAFKLSAACAGLVAFLVGTSENRSGLNVFRLDLVEIIQKNLSFYVFATDAPRAGKKRGKQPVWLSKVMQYHIQPAAKQVGITKRIAWHTFRHTYTTLLHANGEDVKVVQELLRHASAKITLDTYAQAVTPAKRKAQRKIVTMLRRGDERAV